jgi:drug/metabolite transporter (DMT)-like permease
MYRMYDFELSFRSFHGIFHFKGYIEGYRYHPLVYGGVFAAGVAYSLQIYAQREALPAHAAIIFSLESVIAASGGWFILNEVLSKRAIVRCGMMLSDMLIS